MCVTGEIDRESLPNTLCVGNKVVGYSKSERGIPLGKLDYGLLKFNKSNLHNFKTSYKTFDLSEVFKYLIDLGELYSLDVSDAYFDIGSPARLERIERFLDASSR
jgi:NDP-sugar pyrophosphorylase family protein